MTLVSRTAILTFLWLCFFTSALRAQSTEAELKSRLNDKPLYLRGCWNIDNLHFDSNGKLVSNAGQITITLCGFETRSVHLKNDKLIIDGYRVGLELANDKVKRVRLRVVTHPGAPEDEEMHLEIDAPPNGDYSQALDTILVDGLERMVPALPGYWQRYAQKYFYRPHLRLRPSHRNPSNRSVSEVRLRLRFLLKALKRRSIPRPVHSSMVATYWSIYGSSKTEVPHIFP